MLPWWRRRLCDGRLQVSCGRVQIRRYIAESKLAPIERCKAKQGQFYFSKGGFMISYAGRCSLIAMRLVILSW